MDDPLAWFELWALLLTGAAAVLDARSGSIPNWLTLPSLVLAPLAHAVFGPGALGWSIASALLCAAGPLVLFSRGAMGGGDVKLFGAVGAIAGARAGLETQLASYALAAVFALCWFGVRGELQPLLRRSLGLLVAWLRPRGRSAASEPRALTSVRLGVPIFVACAALTAARELGL